MKVLSIEGSNMIGGDLSKNAFSKILAIFLAGGQIFGVKISENFVIVKSARANQFIGSK